MKNYFIRANHAWDAGEHYQAFCLFLAGAKEGDPSSQSSLGYFYDTGIGVKRNIAKAMFWYGRACEIGRDHIGAHNLAIVHRDAGDLAKAMHFFKLAVELGDLDSLCDLADLALRAGDYSTATKLFREFLSHDKKNVFPESRRLAKKQLKKLLELHDFDV